MTYAPISGTKVIGITGSARHGKDTLASFLLQLVPGAERFAFSDAISAYARVSGRMTNRDPSVLQEIGWLMRLQRPSVWLDALYGTICDRCPSLAVITGVRFTDEAQMIRQMGGKLVRVVRVEPDGSPFVDPARDPAHPTESEISSIMVDAELVAASGDIDRLRREAACVL